MRKVNSKILQSAAFVVLVALASTTIFFMDGTNNTVFAAPKDKTEKPTEPDQPTEPVISTLDFTNPEVCRSCHGFVGDRHHVLVNTGAKICLDCHTIQIDDLGYAQMAVERDCTVCHVDIGSGFHQGPTGVHASVVNTIPDDCIVCHGAPITTASSALKKGDEALWIRQLNTATDPDSAGSSADITADFADGSFGKSYSVDNGNGYQVVTVQFNDDPVHYSQVSLFVYVDSAQQGSNVRVYGYLGDGNTVDASAYQDYGISDTGWHRFDVTEVASSMTGAGWMKFRVSSDGKFSTSDGYFLLTSASESAPSGVEEDVCYQCHNDPANSENGINIWAQFNASTDTYGGPDRAGHYERVNTKHDVAAYDQAYSATKLECQNCHHPHLATREYKLIDPDDRKSPFTLTMIHPGSIGSPVDDREKWSNNKNRDSDDGSSTDTTGDTTGETVVDTVTFCLQCHDNTWAADGSVTGPLVIKDIASSYLDSSRSGDEHGAAPGSNNSMLRGPYASWGASSGIPPIPCTDCHDPHGSGGLYNLRTLTDMFGREITLTSENIFTNELGHWCSHCHVDPMNQVEQHGNKGNCLDCHRHGSSRF